MYQQDSNVVESSSMQRRQSNFNPSYFKSSFCVIKFILIVSFETLNYFKNFILHIA